MNPPGDRLEAFVGPARARPALWRLLLGALFAVAVWFAASSSSFAAGRLPGDPGRLFLLAYLASFAGLAAGIAAAARLLQRRRPVTLSAPAASAPRHFAAGVAAIALVRCFRRRSSERSRPPAPARHLGGLAAAGAARSWCRRPRRRSPSAAT